MAEKVLDLVLNVMETKIFLWKLMETSWKLDGNLVETRRNLMETRRNLIETKKKSQSKLGNSWKLKKKN